MDRNDDLRGYLVKSKKGRDLGSYYILNDVLDAYFVNLVDGVKHTFESPKRKNIKHLFIVAKADEDIVRGMVNQDKNCLKNIAELIGLKAKEV